MCPDWAEMIVERQSVASARQCLIYQQVVRPGMKKNRVWLSLGFLVIVAAFHLSNLQTLNCYRLAWYDEGSYVNGAMAWSQGRRPYTDFFFAHPPGIMVLPRLALTFGIGVMGQRWIYWFGGIVLTMLIAILAKILSERNGDKESWAAAGFAAVLVSSSSIALDAETLVMTDLPAAILIVGSVLCLFNRHVLAPAAAAILIVCASSFRVQSLVMAPGLALWIWSRSGWRYGILPCCLFMGSLIGGLFLLHYGLMLKFERYWECVVGFQATRERETWTGRVGFFTLLMEQISFSLGLLASALMLTTRDRDFQGLGLTILLATFASSVVGNSMSPKDFLFIIALMCACAGTLLASSTWVIRDPRALLVAALIVAAIQLPLQSGRIIRPFKLNAWERPLIERITATPYRTIFTTDYKIAFLTGKELPVDYDSVDHFALTHGKIKRFEPWLESILPKCECVIVTDHLLDISPRIAEILLASGKPLIYANAEVEGRVKPLETSNE